MTQKYKDQLSRFKTSYLVRASFKSLLGGYNMSGVGGGGYNPIQKAYFLMTPSQSYIWPLTGKPAWEKTYNPNTFRGLVVFQIQDLLVNRGLTELGKYTHFGIINAQMGILYTIDNWEFIFSPCFTWLRNFPIPNRVYYQMIKYLMFPIGYIMLNWEYFLSVVLYEIFIK